MIRITQLKIGIEHTQQELLEKAAKLLRIAPDQIKELKIIKRSIDARKKSALQYVYTLDIRLDNFSVQEKSILKKVDSKNVMSTKEKTYIFPTPGTVKLSHSPVIVGSGPAGLFCAYELSLLGYAPIVIERGKEVRARKQDVDRFWREQLLEPDSNVQFGEGGAGTFSDGKLNTLVKDVKGRSRFVLETFVSYGAPEHILYDAKPHIGTDILVDVVESMRKAILEAGGRFLFETCFTDFVLEQGRIAGVLCRQKQGELFLPAEVVVLAIGHSARDTFAMLENRGIAMEAKAFAVGFRVEHPQQMISELQYGKEGAGKLPAAPYKVTSNREGDRGVYSFCMCPGGYVVNASSEQGHLAVNGMSYSCRDGKNANSAIIVTVTPKDYPGSGPLSGVRFQQELEARAYVMGNGRIPQQLYGDYKVCRESSDYGDFISQTKGETAFGPLHELFPAKINEAFIRGMEDFSCRLAGFDRYDCILSGVESRTSSPVRILRDEGFLSSMGGVYPCGEGAGYAGGIMSAAMDGLKVAESIIGKFYR